MKIEKVVDEWAREQDVTSNLFGFKVFQITERNIKELKDRLIKQTSVLSASASSKEEKK